MMLTDIDIKDTIYQLLRAKGLHEEISGRIYKDMRPANSMLEDVEISVLAGDAEQIQEFTLNVNVFVADIKRGDEFVENTARLRTLSAAFAEALESVMFERCWISIESQRVVKMNDTALHVINNRISAKVCFE